MIGSLTDMVTDEQLSTSFTNTNYGTNPDRRRIIKEALLKVACGFANGHTTQCIITELRLCSKKSGLTKKGKDYLYISLENSL